MSVPITVPAQLYSLPDDVLRALATFVPLSDVLVLVRCNRHIRVVLQSQLNRSLDRIFVAMQIDDDWVHQAWRLDCTYPTRQPDQRVLHSLFGEANLRGGCRVYCFLEVSKGHDRESILILTQIKDFESLALGDSARYVIKGNDGPARYRFASWLQYRCRRGKQEVDTEAHGSTTDGTYDL
jgi:hypothetical protein